MGWQIICNIRTVCTMLQSSSMEELADRLFPPRRWLAQYKRASFSHDLLAGLTVAFLALPQALALQQSLAFLQCKESIQP
jgi:hypothetical protein